MRSLPNNPPESFRRRNPHLYPAKGLIERMLDSIENKPTFPHGAGNVIQPKPLLNSTEERCKVLLEERGLGPIFCQAFTLRMDPPYKRYTPDLAFLMNGCLNFVEVKGPHRFREKGIAKAALAAKTYPLFKFWLYEWDGKEWKQQLLTP